MVLLLFQFVLVLVKFHSVVPLVAFQSVLVLVLFQSVVVLVVFQSVVVLVPQSMQEQTSCRLSLSSYHDVELCEPAIGGLAAAVQL